MDDYKLLFESHSVLNVQIINQFMALLIKINEPKQKFGKKLLFFSQMWFKKCGAKFVHHRHLQNILKSQKNCYCNIK